VVLDTRSLRIQLITKEKLPMTKAKEKSTKKAPQTDRQRKSASAKEEPKAQVEQDQEPKAESTQASPPNFRADVRVDDQVAQEAERQAQLAQAREEHNRRVAPAA
jgi:hypothetical protein